SSSFGPHLHLFFLNMVASTELGHAVISILKDLGGRSKDDADEIGALEDGAWQAHDGLLAQELFRKDDIVLNVLELGHVDGDHDIHRTLRDNDLETRNLRQDVGAQLGIGLELDTS